MKQKVMMKKIIAISMACMMVFLSVDAGCISALASVMQNNTIVESEKIQNATGAFDLYRDIPRLEESNVDFGGITLDKVVELPNRYDSREKGYVTSIKNQNPWGTCWAFAACAAMESYALSHGFVNNPVNVDFSEYALAYLTFKDNLYQEQTGDSTVTSDLDVGFDAGGNDEYAFKTLSKWAGIYNEGAISYYEDSKNYSGTKNPGVELPAFNLESAECDFVFVGQKYISMQDHEQVKAAIMENGAVTASYFHQDEFENDGEIGLLYYNDSIEKTNHAITIVGWNDNIDAEFFATASGETPDRDGAWLIKNSWGPYYGNAGYMWISYEDVSINLTDAVVYEIAPKSLYDNIYQHDGATVFGSAATSTKFASVYDITGNSAQMIKAVSFAIAGATNANYTVNIYGNSQNATLDKGELVATISGKTTYEGYYTVVLNNPVLAQPNEKYTVEICFDKSVGIVIGYDGYPIGGGGIASTVCDSSESESYRYYYGEYVSLYRAGQPYHNLCIKMFTTDVVEREVPQITNVEMSDRNKATVTWQKIEGALGYKLFVQEMNENASPTETTLTFMNQGNSHTVSADIPVELGKEYKYSVCAVYTGDTASAYSVVVPFVAELPAVELDVTVDANVATLEWNKIGFVDGYRIYRSFSGGAFELLADISATEMAETIRYQDKALVYGYEYTYYVVSYVKPSYTTSHFSNVERVVVRVPSVKNFKLNEYFYEKLVFNWDSLGEVVDGYEIDISKITYDENSSSTEYFTTINVENSETNTYTYTYNIQDLSPGTEIHVEICAYKNTADGIVYSDGNSTNYGSYVIPDEALDVNVKWYVKKQNGINYIAVLLEEQTQESLYIRYYDALDRENPLIAYMIDLSNHKALTLYSVTDIPYSEKGYLYITDIYSKTAYQDVPYVIGGAYVEPKFETISDVIITEAGQKTRLEARIKNPMENFNYRYQWYVATSATDVGTKISGATEAIYDVTVGSYEKKYYYCEVTVEYGEISTFKTSNEKGENTCVIGEGYTSNIKVEFNDEYVYSGQMITPELTVKDGNVVLVKGVDYEVSYTNNLNVGEAIGTITFKGVYHNQKTSIIKFKILPKNADNLTLPSILPVEFTGKEIKPDVEIKDGQKVLSLNADYTITYNNNINAGYGVITLKFTGNYEGTKNILFEIKPKSADGVTYTYSTNESYTGGEIKPGVVIVDGDYTLVPNEDFQLSYENNKNVGTAKIKISFKRNYYGNHELVFSISKRQAADLTIEQIADKQYTGYKIEPELKITFGDITLIKNTDYKVTWSNNTTLGTASVSITFEGNYTGTRTATFRIVERSAENLTYDAIPKQTYTGTGINPDVVIKNGNVTLKNTVDYDVFYKDNINVGNATATITFKGNYIGSKTLNFTIEPKSGNNCSVAPIPDAIYTGSAIEPVVEVKDGEKVLQKDIDYSIGYHKNVNAGEAIVTIMFKGNYTGSLSRSFEIKPMEIKDAVISNIPDQIYNGKAIIPNIQVLSGKREFKNGVDYTAEITNNVNAGVAKVSVTFKGNYCGRAEATFKIVPRTTAKVVISKIENQKYTGKAIEPELVIKDGDIVLVKGQDYEVEFKNNVNAGTASAIVSFKGNFAGAKKEVTFNITDQIPTAITSSSVTIGESNGYMSKISVGTTVSKLLSCLNEQRFVSVLDKKGEKVAETSVVGTGMTAAIMDGNKATKKYTIVVTGDTNGDGKINITDMIAVKACTLKKSDLSGAYEKAGDVNGDGKINITDFIKIKATTLKKDSITGVPVK